jgi:hypothetical protein
MKSLRSQLASAFTALDERDQYDAVLTGLCAKILDQPGGAPVEPTTQALRDPMQLVEEMNTRQIKASPRSLMAFIDVRKNDFLHGLTVICSNSFLIFPQPQ